MTTRRPTAEHPAPDSSENDRPVGAPVRYARRGVLALLVACAAAIASSGFADQEPPPARWVSVAGVGLGLGTILLRRLGASPATGPERASFLTAGALVLCGALGVLGVWLAYGQGSPRSGMLFTLAGAVFAARPAKPLVRAG